MFITNTTEEIIKIPIYRGEESIPVVLAPGQSHDFIITSRVSFIHYYQYVVKYKLGISGVPERFKKKKQEEPEKVVSTNSKPLPGKAPEKTPVKE